jgi:oxygen-independent coproporphyrinogen-3 oxidase
MDVNTSHALYIHWPFCKKKCPYCDFNSHVRKEIDEAAWEKALLSELSWTLDKAEKRPVSSIFFGGGTPSLMPPRIAEKLIEKAEYEFGLIENCEITLEANPTSVENQKLQVLREAGINRISIGVQSFKAEALQFLGREHSAEEALEAISLATNLFDRFSFDLIYALPEQSLKSWEEELRYALSLAGDHLSLYQLTIEPGTQFFHHHQSGKIHIPEASLAADFYQLTQQTMEAARMPAYEISNHAKPGQGSRHNIHIWRGGSYLGIGPGAHGRPDCKNGQRAASYSLRSPEKWLAHVAKKGHGNESFIILEGEEKQIERILMELRLTDGLQMESSHWPKSYLEALQEEGLITFTSRSITPTMKGNLLLNRLTHGLIDNFT